MYRLLLLALALPLLTPADLGRASSAQFNYDIVAISLAGRQTNLTHNPAIDAAPAVARDGRVVFASDRDGTSDLYVMDGSGGNVHRLTNGAVDHSGVALDEDLQWTQASWSPRGDKIAFDGKYLAAGPPCEQHCAGWDVFVIGSDGSGLTKLALGARAPGWSPDGRSLAYESGVIDTFGDAGGMMITRLDGSGSVQLQAYNGFSDVGPVWSPRGGEIAFQAIPTGGSRTWIYLIRADGRRKRRLVAGTNPVWSANGKRLAFIDRCKLLTIDRNGGRKRRLSRTGEFVIGAAWSPKGRTLAYLAGTEAYCDGGLPTNLRLVTVGVDGKRVHVLARESAAALFFWASPVWTPNGKRILVVEYH